MSNARGWKAAALAGAGLLAGSSLFTALQARFAERKYPPEGRFIDVDGVRLHYIEEGKGTPVVLLHGQGSLLQDFALSILPVLSKRYRVLAFDRPGYGYSSRPIDRRWTAKEQALLFRTALKQIGVEAPIIVGHSWGALCALAYAISFPSELRAAVLISGFYYPVFKPSAKIPGLMGQPVIGTALSHTVAGAMLLASAPLRTRAKFWPSNVPDRYKQFPTGLVARPEQIIAYGDDSRLLVSSAAELAPMYGGVQVPLAIVAGRGDLVLSWRDHSLRLHREVPNSTFHLVPGGGHMSHHVDPELIVRLIDGIEGGDREARGPLEDNFSY